MRKILLAVIALILISGGWWYASPYWTLHQMQAAAQRGDSQALSAYIDYPAVRENLKSQLGQMMPHDCYSPDQCKGVAALATLIINPLIDRMVTPEGLQAAFEHRNLVDAKPGPKLPDAPSEPVIHRNGLGQFTVTHKDSRKGAFLFKRSGLGWKLVGLNMPSGRESPDENT